MAHKNTYQKNKRNIKTQSVLSKQIIDLQAKADKIIKESQLLASIAGEIKDRSRKTIQTWRATIRMAENYDNPKWHVMQDLIDDIIIDAHLASVIQIRKSSTLNTRFQIVDKKTNKKLEEQTDFINKKWFYDFLDNALDAIIRKYSLIEITRNGDKVVLQIIPHRNVCIQKHIVFPEVSADDGIDYREYANVIEIVHNSQFGILNDVAANVIWKRNLLQSNAEFAEKFGMPLITAITNNRAEASKINDAIKNFGENGTSVLPTGTEIQIHDLANAGNPEAVYLLPAEFHDKQISKRFIGSTTITDQGANRAQTEIHEDTLNFKISQDDKRFISFIINDNLLPILQNIGFPFNTETMQFCFDETENLTLKEQWEITRDALNFYELDENTIRETFNLPITGKKEQPTFPAGGGAFSANFR